MRAGIVQNLTFRELLRRLDPILEELTMCLLLLQPMGNHSEVLLSNDDQVIHMDPIHQSGYKSKILNSTVQQMGIPTPLLQADQHHTALPQDSIFFWEKIS